MTSENDDLQQRQDALGKSYTENEGKNQKGFSDPNLKYPTKEYNNQSSVNKSSRGEKPNNLAVKSGIPGKAVNYNTVDNYEYTHVQTDESPSGHIIEINDTPGGERVLIKHNCGAGVDIQPDGTILVNSTGNRVEISSGNYSLSVGGDGHIVYNGNLSMTVTGDYNLNVKGDYNVNVGGNKIMKVLGSYRKTITKHLTEKIIGSKSSTVLQQVTNTFLDGVNTLVKGTFKQMVRGKGNYFHSDVAKFTSETGIDMSTVNMNLAADNLTAVGAVGTMGGKDMIMYTKNIYANENVDTKTLSASDDIKVKGVIHGNLDGTASKAQDALRAKGAISKISALTLTPKGGTISTDFSKNNGATALPDSQYMNEHLRKSNLGYRIVKIDEDDGIKNSIDQTENNDGISDRDLTISEVRSKLKNTNNFNNGKFTLNQISKGILSAEYKSKAPDSIGRVRGEKYTATTGSKSIGNSEGVSRTKRFIPSQAASKSKTVTLLPETVYNISKMEDVSMSTKLSQNQSLSKFVSTFGDPINLNHVNSPLKRKAIARNLSPHVEILELYKTLDDFNGYSLEVVEGLYKLGIKEKFVADSITDLKTQGRAIVYELYDVQTGKLALDKTFDLAVYLKDNAHYDKLSLYYDKFDMKQEKHHAQIVITTPLIPVNYKAFFKMKVDTFWNNELLSNSDLVEIPSINEEEFDDTLDDNQYNGGWQ